MEKNPVLDFKYDFVDNSSGEELVIVGRNDKNNSIFYKYGFVDCYGNEVVPCVYDKVGEFRDGIAPVYINGKGWGIISKDEVLVAPKYLFLHPQVESAIRGQTEDGFVVFKNSKGKYACLSKEDKWVPFEYDDITLYGFSHEGLICVGKNIEDAKLLGLLDKDGKEILPCKYKSISKFENGVASVEIDGNKYWINKEGNEVSQPEVTDAKKSVYKEYEIVERDGKYGIVDKDGNAITPFKYDRIETQNVYRPNIIRFFDGYICVRINDLRGLVNEKGEEVVPCKHEVIQNISNGMFVSVSYSAGKKFGLYDTKGNEILPVIYSFIHIFKNGLVFVQKGSKYALIGVPSETAKEPEKKSKVKKVKAPLKYSEIGTFSEGLVSVKGKYYGFIDKDGNEVLTTDYVYGGKGGFDAADMFVDGMSIVKKSGCYGFIDKDGNEVIPCNYSGAYRFRDGVARVCSVKERIYMFGFINKEGNEVVPLKYIVARDFSEGLAAVKADDGRGFGFIDASDKEVLPFKYDNAMSFSEGLAAVKIDGKWGFIDKNGNEVIPCRYDEVSSFSEGRASVLSNNKYGFIDKEGNEVIPCRYDGVGNYSEGLASVFSKFRYGYIDMDGNEVIPCKYHSAEEFKDGLAIVSLEGKLGAIDKKGEVVVLLRYDKITIGDEYIFVREGKKCGLADKEGKSI